MSRKKKVDLENEEVKQDMEEITMPEEDTANPPAEETSDEATVETEEAEEEAVETTEDVEETEEVEEIEETDAADDEEISEEVVEEMEFEEESEDEYDEEEEETSEEAEEKPAKQVNMFLRENENPFSFADSFKKWKKWFSLHSRTVFPVVLILLLAVVIGIGVRIGGKGEKKQPAEQNAVTASSESNVAASSDSAEQTQQIALEQSTDEALNQLILNYYTAMANGDTNTIATLVNPATEGFLAKVRTIGDYIDSYPAINVYVKQGPTVDSKIAYVHTEILMAGYNQNVPSLQTFYVCTDQSGNYYINMNEELSEEEANYIHDADLQEDVIDLNNKITAEFNDLLAQDTTFASYYAKASSQIKASVGQAVAETDATAEAQPEETTETTEEQPETQVVKKVRATDVVNMRASDSENADKLGKAQIGDTFTLVEEKANGWSKVKNGDTEVFIKSQYLEVVEEQTVEAPAQQEEQQPEQQTEQQTTTTTELGKDGYVTAKTTVNIRKTASENGEKLGTVYQGTKLDYVMNQADGWCKVKYKGQTAYVKSDYVE